MLYLLVIPMIPIVAASMLGLTVWFEDHLISPEAMIRASVRRGTPDDAEWQVTRQAELLLRGTDVGTRQPANNQRGAL